MIAEIDETNALSTREHEVLEWISKGKTDPEIGMILGLAEGTVSSHVFHIKKKFDVHTRAHAVAKGFRCGLLA